MNLDRERPTIRKKVLFYIARIHQLRQALVDCPHVAIVLRVRRGIVAIREKHDKIVLRIVAEYLKVVCDGD
jgi:hypothetical protein